MLYLCKPAVTDLLQLSPFGCERAYINIVAGGIRPIWVSFDHKVHPEEHKFNLLRPGRLRKVLDNIDQVIFVSFAVTAPDYEDTYEPAELQQLIKVGLSGYHRIAAMPEELKGTDVYHAARILSSWADLELETLFTVPLQSHALRWHIDHAGSEYAEERLETIPPCTFNYPYRNMSTSYIQAEVNGAVQTASSHREACYFMNPRDVRHRVEYEDLTKQRRLLMFRQFGFSTEKLASFFSKLGLLETV